MATQPSAETLRRVDQALDEVTPGGAVGDVVDAQEADGVLTLRYESALAGYPDWEWTVTLSTVDDPEGSVLEIALLPSAGSLVAPDWVPWTDRLADYLAAKDAAEAEGAVADDADDDEDDADDDEDDAGDDVDGAVDDFDDIDEDDLVAHDIDDADLDADPLDDDGTDSERATA